MSSNDIEKIIQTSFDKKIWNQLHQHQKDGVKFLMKRLLSDRFPVSDEYRTIIAERKILETGAILADEMGTGKTLIGLVTTSILCRYLSCKAIIVCPSNLTNNWEREIQKWFPGTLSRCAIIVGLKSKSAKAMDLEVNQFVTSHALLSPLLIISYDLYRIYAEALNTIGSLEILLCDEGHKYLKNLFTTKTGLLLNNAIPTRRMLFTGTVIQNNLKELYSMISFIIPNYFQKFSFSSSSSTSSSSSSSVLLSEDPFILFKNEFIDYSLSKSLEMDEKSWQKLKSQQLSEILSKIILKRNKEEILSLILPKKFIYSIFFPMNLQENENYQRISDSIISSLSSSLNFTDKNKSNILGKLSELRLFTSTGGMKEEKEIIVDVEKPKIWERSEKLKYVYQLLKGLHQRNEKVLNQMPPPGSLSSSSSFVTIDKIIIVSNYLSTLDLLKSMCSENSWNCLRIDGTVPKDRRYKMIDFFNKSISASPSETIQGKKNPFFILLLSSKVGGIGINLIGANHLILMEPDWNPANDAQIMGRIWRQGQCKPSFIYRLLYGQTIEEFMAFQQVEKEKLNALIQETRNDSSSSFQFYESIQRKDQSIEDEKNRAKSLDCLPALSSDDEENEDEEEDFDKGKNRVNRKRTQKVPKQSKRKRKKSLEDDEDIIEEIGNDNEEEEEEEEFINEDPSTNIDSEIEVISSFISEEKAVSVSSTSSSSNNNSHGLSSTKRRVVDIIHPNFIHEQNPKIFGEEIITTISSLSTTKERNIHENDSFLLQFLDNSFSADNCTGNVKTKIFRM